MILELKRHRNSKTVWEFSDKNIPHPQALIWTNYCQVIDDILSFPRSGWLLRQIPSDIAETVSAHCSKVAIATSLYIDWQGSADMRANKDQIVLTGWLHDLAEWKAPDYTPHDIVSGLITVEQKRSAEFGALRMFAQTYGDALPENLFAKLEDNSNSPENQLIHQLDKLDAGIMALNYEAHWYDVGEFFPYTKAKLSDPFLKSAFEWLLKKEFPTLDYFYQYCMFLYFHGDVEKVREYLWISKI
jgi:5'-deoxynucleotidase YfbR-like HD superfamily hydrolase